VNEEIRHFKTLGRIDRIIAIIIDGEPNAADREKAKAGFRPDQECLPPALRYGVMDNTGEIDWDARVEPAAIDLRVDGRPEQGFTTSAALAESLRVRGVSRTDIAKTTQDYEQRLESMQVKLVASILGVPLETMVGRDAQYRLARATHNARRNRRLLAEQRQIAQDNAERAIRQAQAAQVATAAALLLSGNETEATKLWHTIVVEEPQWRDKDFRLQQGINPTVERACEDFVKKAKAALTPFQPRPPQI
jgi:hypothetical protein